MASSKINAADYFPEDPTDDSVVDDLSMIPLEKDTFAICELCGRIGRRGQFYPRNTKYCSLRCNVSATRRKHCNWRFKMMEGTEHMAGMIPLEPLPQLHSWHANFNDIQTGPSKHSAANVTNSYEWKDELFGCDFLAAPVSLFKHAPLHEMWDSTFEGMKVEVKNTDCINVSEKLGDYFWVATVLKVKGYMGLLRYEGFGSDDSKDFWVNLCCSEVHPVGWCATRGKPLIPPKTIEHKYNDWKKFLVKQLTGARTLPANFYSKLTDSLKSRFTVGTVLEVVDKNRISQVKVASVHEIVGKRLHIKYYDSIPEDNGFWCHEDSPLIHPVGWAFKIGHPLDAPITYSTRVAAGRMYPSDSTPEMFYNYPNTDPPLFSKGMKLEAIDPLNLSSICAATVMEILSEGYMMIRIDFYPPEETGADWFCYHQRSPCIFPVGFAMANNLALVPPIGYTPENFKWEEYLASTDSEAAGRTLFTPRGHLVSHGFVAGMRLECADLMDPRLVCVATVARVVADLLKIHFDGWGDEYDQWLWAHSTDIYPVGWCKAVGHRLEGPLQPPPRPPRPVKKPRAAKPSRRRKKPLPHQNNQPPNTNEESSQNSDIADTKCMSPLTTVSEISADVDTRHSMTNDHTMEAAEHNMETGEHNVETGEHNMETGEHNMETGEYNMQSGEHNMDSGEHNMEGIEMEGERMKKKDKQGHRGQDRSAAIGGKEPQQEKTKPPKTKPSEDQKNNSKDDKKDKPSRIPSPKAISQQETNKVIPRLVNNANVPLDILNSVDPITWTTEDVAKFLTINDCQPYCDNFRKIPGPLMLKLTKDEIIELLQMKVGPSLKIFDLIQQLKCKIKQPQRLLGNFK